MTDNEDKPVETVTIDEVVSIDLDSLTIGEIEEIEDRTDMPIDALGQSEKKGRMLRAIVFVTRRRSDPDFTWEQAGDLRISFKDTGDDAPKEAAE